MHQKRSSLAFALLGLGFLVLLGGPLRAQSSTGELSSLLRQAKLFLSSRNIPQAIAVYEQAAQLAQDNPQIWGSLGYLYVHQGRFLEAVTAYENALAIDPQNPQYYDGLGFSYGHLGVLDKAWTAYATAINLEPKNPKHYLALGVVLLRLGKYDRLENISAQVLTLDPNHQEAMVLRASALVQKGEWDRAIAFIRSQKLAPNLELALQLAKAQAGKGELEEAKATLQPWWQKTPASGALWLVWGLLLEQEKNYASALASYSKALQLAPQSWEAGLGIGKMYLALDNPPPALRHLRPLAAKHPHNGDVLYFLGLAYYRNAQPQQGLPYLQQAQKIYQTQNNEAGLARVDELLKSSK